jgi:cell division protein FtsQ
VLWLLGVVALAAAGTGAVLSPLLDINQIAIHGADGAHADEVRSVIGIEPGEALLLVDTGAAAARVEALTWVDEVRVERKLPGTLRVEVIPRFPVGWRRGSQDSAVLLDRFGGTISREAQPPPGIPQVDASGDGIAAAAEVAAALSPTMRPEVWQIVVRDGRVSALLASGVEVRFGDATQARAKVTAAEAVIKALNGAFIQYIDVSVPSAPATG